MTTEQKYIVALDQGTTSSRAVIMDHDANIVCTAQREFTQIYPKAGWVEHDPMEIWASQSSTMVEALAKVGIRTDQIAGIGITNQRETTIVWDKNTGKPVYNAIVWQCRRTAEICQQLKQQPGLEAYIRDNTGLVVDPYFSGTKIKWILDNVEGAREQAEAGNLLFGTVDTWLIWQLTGGKVHATDATNASRTLIYNIHENEWDAELCRLLNIPESLLPRVMDSADDFGKTDADLFGREIPILGVAGDQQAATVGQACFKPGMVKSTYGTGCFALMNTGKTPVKSNNRMLTTIAYRLNGETTYALEGSIFVAGAAVQWLRDGLGLIESAGDTQALAEAADPNQDVYLVPAFVGLGAPYWDADARGALFGLTRNTGPKEIARAVLQSVGYQTSDLVEAMQADWPDAEQPVLRVDGGMTASDWTMQFLADILGAPVDRPTVAETTALGAAWLAGSKAGLWPGADAFSAQWQLEKRFEPQLQQSERARLLAGWRDAVKRTRTMQD